MTLIKGTSTMLDPSCSLYAATGSGNLRGFVDGQDTVSRDGLPN
jgi:hypothetical protein